MEEKYLRKQRIYRTIMLTVLTAFVTAILTTVYLVNNYDFGSAPESISSIIEEIKTSDDNNLTTSLEKIEKLIKKYYLNEIDEKKVIEGAIKGYISALGDEYTEYISIDDMEDYTEEITGKFVGIGIYMVKNTENNTIEVLMPIKGSPAEKAGILPEDVIVSVDGTKYSGDEMTAASNNIKGEVGTKVEIEILRKEETIKFEITREEIIKNPVVSEKLDNNVGYLNIPGFDEGIADDFKKKFEELKNQGITSLIIDLRNNGGGLVDESLQIAEYIIPKGKTLLITTDKNDKEEIRKSKEDPIIDMPIVVLVNKNTASASEILAGALKDNEEATLIGTQTYGKGVIQQILSLNTGAGLKITIEEYYTPNKIKINKVGIEPNEVVELPEKVTSPLQVTREDDTQLKRAIEKLSKGE